MIYLAVEAFLGIAMLVAIVRLGKLIIHGINRIFDLLEEHLS